MVQVRVLGIALDSLQRNLVLLKPLHEETGTGLVLPVWIGSQEATSILIALEGRQAPRPLSHDLIATLFAAVGAELQRVDLTRIEEGTFFAELSLTTPTGPQTIDSRPSDAIALAAASRRAHLGRRRRARSRRHPGRDGRLRHRGRR